MLNVGWKSIVLDHMASLAPAFNIVPDPGRKIYSLFAEKYIPRNIIIDSNGNIIYQATGFNDKEFAKLKETIETELNK